MGNPVGLLKLAHPLDQLAQNPGRQHGQDGGSLRGNAGRQHADCAAARNGEPVISLKNFQHLLLPSVVKSVVVMVVVEAYVVVAVVVVH